MTCFEQFNTGVFLLLFACFRVCLFMFSRLFAHLFEQSRLVWEHFEKIKNSYGCFDALHTPLHTLVSKQTCISLFATAITLFQRVPRFLLMRCGVLFNHSDALQPPSTYRGAEKPSIRNKNATLRQKLKACRC